jgi:hypothetical protein
VDEGTEILWSRLLDIARTHEMPFSEEGVSMHDGDPMGALITPEEIDRYLLIQKSPWGETFFVNCGAGELQETIVQRADEEDWTLTEVIDLLTGEPVKYRLRAEIEW